MNYIPSNFKYPTIENDHRKYAGSFLSNPILRADGDWRSKLPLYEEQRRNNIEPSSCFIEAQQHTIATIEENSLGEINNNYSARFNAYCSGGTINGGDPITGADSIRHDGLVSESVMPHDDSIRSWDEFHSWKGVDENTVRNIGKKDLEEKHRQFGVIVEKDMPLDSKYSLIKEGLKRSPLPMSVWGVTDNDGNYIQKPSGVSDTHMVEATYLDDNDVIHILDTYPPFEKKLPPKYNPDFAMGWIVTENPKLSTGSMWSRFVVWCKMQAWLWNFLTPRE